MAVNDSILVEGTSRLIKSSGEIPSPLFIDGESQILHEHVETPAALVSVLMDGKSELALSTGKTPSYVWVDGDPRVINYSEPIGSLVLIAMYHYTEH